MSLIDKTNTVIEKSNIDSLDSIRTIKDINGNSLFLVLKHSWHKFNLEQHYKNLQDPYLRLALDTYINKQARYYTICGYYIKYSGSGMKNYRFINKGDYTEIETEIPYSINTIPGLISSLETVYQICSSIIKNVSSHELLYIGQQYKKYYSDIKADKLPDYFSLLKL